MAAYLLKSSLAQFRNVVCRSQTISCLLSLKRETNGSPQPLVSFLPYERKQEVHKCTRPKHFRVSSIKISCHDERNFSNIAADNVTLMQTANKFTQSLRVSFTDVGYNISQVETFSVVLIDIIVYFEQVYCWG